MIKFHQVAISVVLGLSFLLNPLLVSAQNYGDNVYGGGDYNVGTVNSSSSSNNSSSSSSSSSASSGCNNTPPTKAPDLFQINTTSTTAIIYFAPAGQPYDNYYVSFGMGELAEQYGGAFNQSVVHRPISYQINFLNPNTIYSFKVRGGNGCTAGDWSNIMKAKTTTNKTRTSIFYKNTFVAVTSTLRNIVSQSSTKNAITVPNPQTQPPTQNPPAQNQPKQPTPAPQVPQNNPQPNFFQQVISGIKGLFGR